MAYTPEFDLRDDQFRNYIINGDMRIAQRGTSFYNPAAGNTYTLDRWAYGKAGSATHSITQDTDAPSFTQSGYNFQNSLRLNLTSASASLAATDYYIIYQRVEGYNFASLAQKAFTISFWVKASLPGTYCVGLANSNRDRSFVKEFTVNSASVWEKKTIQVAASPSAGTWDYTTGRGLEVCFVIAAGSSFQTTQGVWQSGNYLSTPSLVNGVSSAATDFRITGVSINEGVEPLPFKLAGGNFAGELVMCQRYYELKKYSGNTYSAMFVTYNGGNFFGSVQSFSVPKRTVPFTSLSYDNLGGWHWVQPGIARFSADNNSTGTTVQGTVDGWYIQQIRQAGNNVPTNGNIYYLEATFNIKADAEL